MPHKEKTTKKVKLLHICISLTTKMSKCVHIKSDGTICGRSAIYGPPKGKKIHCSVHKETGVDTDLVNPSCEKCSVGAGYGYVRGKGLRCATHKEADMIAVRGKFCKGKNSDGSKCNEKAMYNLPGSGVPIVCRFHKDDHMVHITKSKCIKCNQGARSFGPFGEPGKRCGKCKESGDVNVACPICVVCRKNQSAWSLTPDGNANWCYQCKPKDAPLFDVRRKYCIHVHDDGTKCTTTATRNFKGIKKPIYCAEHQKDGMRDVMKPYCKKCDEVTALFGWPKDYKGDLEGEEINLPLYCSKCKFRGMEDLTRAKCNKCQSVGGWIKHNKNVWCRRCLTEEHPEVPRNRMFLFKQNTITKDLQDHFTFDLINRKVPGGKSIRRPDLAIIFKEKNFVQVIEIDENQHCQYDDEDLKIRMEEIQADFNLPTKFLHFNPDAYQMGKKRIQGMFVRSKEEKTKNYEARLKDLIEEIRKHCKSPPKEDIEAHFHCFTAKKIDDTT